MSGFTYSRPDYDPAAFFYRDVGVVVLDAPAVMSEYGELPELDDLKTRRGKKNQTFTAVGYDLQRINPQFVEAERVRMVAEPHLIQINVPGFTATSRCSCRTTTRQVEPVSETQEVPNFLGDSNGVVGVTSFEINGNCAGTGGVFRMDRSWSLDSVDTFLNP